MNRLSRILAGATSIVLALPALSSAQSLWAVNGPTATVGRFNGGPAGPCAFPAGPVLGVGPYAPAFFGCPTAGPVAGPAIGDIALDRTTDTMWVTDGVVVTNYTRAGVVINSKPAPVLTGAPITGLGFGVLAVGPVLWVTDGIMAAAVALPTAVCAPFVFAVPPFPLPAPAMGAATDIDFDPVSGTLFVSTMAGFVENVLIGGAVGPFGVFVPACGGGGVPLVGIAVDTSTCGTLFVTTGPLVMHVGFAGVPAAPTIYAPVPCFPFPGPPGTNGLTFDAAGVPFGTSCDPVLPPPTMGTFGQATTPGPGFGVTLTGAAPGIALLVVGGPTCPPGILGVCPVYTLPALLTIGPFPSGAALTIPLPIPAGVPCTTGAIGLQFLIGKTGGGFQTTNGIEVSVAQL